VDIVVPGALIVKVKLLEPFVCRLLRIRFGEELVQNMGGFHRVELTVWPLTLDDNPHLSRSSDQYIDTSVDDDVLPVAFIAKVPKILG
jgi:hypothetical protein